jgi:hypothetical protein
VDVIATVNGVSSLPTVSDTFTYQAAVLTTSPVTIPALAKGTGYWVTFTTNGSGTVGATWASPTRIQGTLSIYSGNPFVGQPDPARVSPPSGALTSDKGNKASFAAAIVGQPAGTYTVYFFTGTAVGASTGTVTAMK